MWKKKEHQERPKKGKRKKTYCKNTYCRNKRACDNSQALLIYQMIISWLSSWQQLSLEQPSWLLSS